MDRGMKRPIMETMGEINVEWGRELFNKMDESGDGVISMEVGALYLESHFVILHGPWHRCR